MPIRETLEDWKYAFGAFVLGIEAAALVLLLVFRIWMVARSGRRAEQQQENDRAK